MTDDGPHRLSKIRPYLTSVVVTPLDETYRGSLVRFTFSNMDKELAVSVEDAEKIKRLLGGHPENRKIVLEAKGDLIRISVSQ